MPRTLRNGDTGEDVREVQYLLNYHLSNLFPIAVDGVFGHETEGRVRLFQTVNHIDPGTGPDGVVGSHTRAYLYTPRTVQLTTTVKLAERPMVAAAGRPMAAQQAGRPHLMFNTAIGFGDIVRAGSDPPPFKPGVVVQLPFPDTVTIQPGGQVQLANWLAPHEPGFTALSIQVQGNYFTKKDGFHLEMAPGLAAQLNNQPSDARFNVTGFVQVTGAGLPKLGPVQLSPFAQAQWQAGFPQGSRSLGGQLGGQATVDILSNNYQLFMQGALAGNVDLNKGTVSLSPVLAAGFMWTFAWF